MHPKKILREYFHFDRQRRRAILALLIISIVVVVLPYAIFPFQKKENFTDAKLDSVKQVLFAEHKGNFGQASGSLNELSDNLFYFNPNQASLHEWDSLGVSEAVAKRIVNYISKGGAFKTPSDLLKTYGFRQSDFDRLSPYMIFEPQNAISSFKNIHADQPLQNFNPNTISSEEWTAMGVPASTAARIINYHTKGGVFKSAADVLKIYGFRQEDYDRLQAYMIFDIQDPVVSNAGNIKDSMPVTQTVIYRQITDINSASKEQFIQLGFSADDAKHIINFRSGLGGFYDREQLRGIDGIDQKSLDEAFNFLVADKKKIEKININDATYEELEKHIYISPALAQAIIDYRTTYGNFIVLTEIKKVKGMHTTLYEKLNPYITI